MQEESREKCEKTELEHTQEERTVRPKKKISSYLPVCLLKDLSFDEDSISDEIEEFSPEKRKGKNLGRRRSSSHDFLNTQTLNMLNLLVFNVNNQIQPQNFIQPMNGNQINLIRNSNRQMTVNNGMLGDHHSTKKPIIKQQNIINETTNPNKKVNFNTQNNTTFFSKKVNNPRKSAQREFIDPDLLNPNQSFKEFLSNSGSKLSSVIKTSIGSRFLQKMLDKVTEEDIDIIFTNLQNELTYLMCDNYGNYFMQKIILKCNLKQRLFLYEKLDKNFIEVAKNIAGTHCIQSLIGSIETEKEESIIKEKLINNLLELSCNANSTHVIQKIVSDLPEPKRDYVNIFIFSNFLSLCKDPNGICLIKKFISENKEEGICRNILLILEKNCFEITQDQYGNYAIQHALDKYGYAKCHKILSIICSKVVFFANQKFSSNVVDKIVVLLHSNNYNDFTGLIQILFLNESNIIELLKNKFGMFVLINTTKLLSNEQKYVIKNFLIEKVQFCKIEDRIYYSRMLKQL